MLSRRVGSALLVVVLATLALTAVSCSGDDGEGSAATTIDPTSTSVPRGDGLGRYAVRLEDLPDKWSEARPDLSGIEPATGEVCLVDFANPEQVTAVEAWEAAPDDIYERKIATFSMELASTEVAEEFDARLASGAAGSCYEQQASEGLSGESGTTIDATTVTTPLETDLDSSYLITTTADVPAAGQVPAQDHDQTIAVLRQGTTLVMVFFNSAVGPFEEELRSGLIDLTVERLGG